MSNHRPVLSKKLSRTIILLAIPLFVLALSVFYRYANVLIHKEAQESSTTILNLTVQLVENYLSTIATAANSNVWMLEENFNPDSLRAVSRRIVQLNRSVLSCSVGTEPDAFPQYGRYFSVYSVNEGDTIISVLEPEYEYFEKNWYKKPMRTGHPCWINPFSDFNEGTINHHDAVGSYCIPLRPDGNRIAGVISADFSFQTLRETILATHHPYPNSYYMLLGPVGGYLIHPESSLLFKKTIFSATDSIEHPDIIALGREMTSGRHGIMHVTFDNELCHVCYAPVPGTGWSLALVCHEDDVLEDHNYLSLVMIAIIVIGLLLILWITRCVVRRNIGPINELMEATNKIAGGNYDTVIPASKHKDVVGKLQNAFRDMQLAIISHTDSIRQTDEEIKQEAAELEQTLPLAKEVAKRKQIFIQSVSRQIHAPLNVISGLADVLQANLVARSSGSAAKEPKRQDEMRNFTNTMKHNAGQLYRMTLMLYDISYTRQADTTRYERSDNVSCNELARECISNKLAECSVEEFRFETELPDSFCVRTNRLFLTRTISELLQNAAKYSDGNNISLRITKTETVVVFTVEDVGPGLPKGSEEMIFTPFAKVDDLSVGLGLGLGLPLCKMHMDALGGSIIYDSSYQKGCRFIVEVPISV